MNGLYNVSPRPLFGDHDMSETTLELFRKDEADCVGVGEADWAFKTTFKAAKEQLAEPHADLLFEGLDTFCDISLVGPSTPQVSLKTEIRDDTVADVCRTGNRSGRPTICLFTIVSMPSPLSKKGIMSWSSLSGLGGTRPRRNKLRTGVQLRSVSPPTAIPHESVGWVLMVYREW